MASLLATAMSFIDGYSTWELAIGLASSVAAIWFVGRVRHFFAGRKSYKGKTIVITGASSGIGAEMARKFAADGANIVLAARREDKLAEVAAQVKKLGGFPLVVKTDVTKFEDCENLIQRSVKKFGGIDVLIPNAGFGCFGIVDSWVEGDETVQRIIDVNLKGAITVTAQAAKYLRASNGVIAPVLSVAGRMAQPFLSIYCGTKFGMKGFFESIRMEGLNVTLICPGPLLTEFAETLKMSDNCTKTFPENLAKNLESLSYPLKAACSEYKCAISRGDLIYTEGVMNKVTLGLYNWFPGLVGKMLVDAMAGPILKLEEWKKYLSPGKI